MNSAFNNKDEAFENAHKPNKIDESKRKINDIDQDEIEGIDLTNSKSLSKVKDNQLYLPNEASTTVNTVSVNATNNSSSILDVISSLSSNEGKVTKEQLELQYFIQTIPKPIYRALFSSVYKTDSTIVKNLTMNFESEMYNMCLPLEDAECSYSPLFASIFCKNEEAVLKKMFPDKRIICITQKISDKEFQGTLVLSDYIGNSFEVFQNVGYQGKGSIGGSKTAETYAKRFTNFKVLSKIIITSSTFLNDLNHGYLDNIKDLYKGSRDVNKMITTHMFYSLNTIFYDFGIYKRRILSLLESTIESDLFAINRAIDLFFFIPMKTLGITSFLADFLQYDRTIKITNTDKDGKVIGCEYTYDEKIINAQLKKEGYEKEFSKLKGREKSIITCFNYLASPKEFVDMFLKEGQTTIYDIDKIVFEEGGIENIEKKLVQYKRTAENNNLLEYKKNRSFSSNAIKGGDQSNDKNIEQKAIPKTYCLKYDFITLKGLITSHINSKLKEKGLLI